MIMQTKWTLMLSLFLVAAVVQAQTTTSSLSTMGSSEQGMSSSSSSMQSQQAFGASSVDLARGSSIIGAKVVNPQGEDLGSIHEVVLNSQRDQINYAVLAHGGVAGIGEKLIAIPWSEFQVQSTTTGGRSITHPLRGKKHTTGTMSREEIERPGASSAAYESQSSQYSSSQQQQMQGQRLMWNKEEHVQLTLNSSKDQLSRVAGFDKDAWPEQASANWQQQTQQPQSQQEPSSAQKAQFDTRKLSKVIGTRVESATPITFREAASTSSEQQSGASRSSMQEQRSGAQEQSSTRSASGRTDIGKIKDCVLNSDNGRLIYCVVSLDEVPNHTREMSVVPWEAIRVTTTSDNKQIAQLQVTSGESLLAFTFRSNQQPDLADRTYLERVYTAYNVEPQWEALGFVPPSGTSRDQMQQQHRQQRQDRQMQRQQRQQQQRQGSESQSQGRY